ncbi:MAG TPA: lysophospholipid acyltransferase family protein [Myxococcaceae bacterium]|nr:lysophospholipid acyltransferase family protein [Myxococcaceae bacterium]
MIRARKGGLLGWAWGAYVDRKFRSAFRGLWARGRPPEGNAPLLVYANHSNWWDGFVAHALCRARGWDGYCLMEEANLLKYRFLARLGAFSIRRHDAGSALETLRYALGLLSRPGAAVWLFPEGELRPFGARPVSFERGLEVLAKHSDARCVPVGIRYAFFESELPDVLCEVGEAHGPLPLRECEARLQALVERLQAVHSLEGFERWVRGGRGVAERWDGARGLGEGRA